MSDLAEQQRFRRSIIDFLQNGRSDTVVEGDGIVMGFLLIVEMQAADGSRHALLCTSDASGTPLPWYACVGLLAVPDKEDEFDEDRGDDD